MAQQRIQQASAIAKNVQSGRANSLADITAAFAQAAREQRREEGR